jgi:hypothetical protein
MSLKRQLSNINRVRGVIYYGSLLNRGMESDAAETPDEMSRWQLDGGKTEPGVRHH